MWQIHVHVHVHVGTGRRNAASVPCNVILLLLLFQHMQRVGVRMRRRQLYIDLVAMWFRHRLSRRVGRKQLRSVGHSLHNSFVCRFVAKWWWPSKAVHRNSCQHTLRTSVDVMFLCVFCREFVVRTRRVPVWQRPLYSRGLQVWPSARLRWPIRWAQLWRSRSDIIQFELFVKTVTNSTDFSTYQ